MADSADKTPDRNDIVSVWDKDGNESKVTYSRSLTLLARGHRKTKPKD